MTGDSPSWVDLDLQAGPVSPALQLPPEDGEEGPTTVMIMATVAAREQGWAARAALHLVREWTRAGSRIFLMDLNLDAPDLHGVLGHENREGVSDVVLYGASVPRVSRPVDGGAFYLATAGTAVADASEVLSHSRWAEVINGFREAGVTLVLYCPHELLDSSPLTRASKVRILLRGPGEGDEDVAPESPTPTAVAGPGLRVSGDPERRTLEDPSAETPDHHGEVESSVGGGLDADETAQAAPGESGPEQREVALQEGHLRSLDSGSSESPTGPDSPREGSAPEAPRGPKDRSASPAPEAPGDPGELGGENVEPQPGIHDAGPPEPAHAPPPVSGKPREVAGSGGGNALRNALLVVLLLLGGVLLADYLGYLDLSSIVDLPWHEAATATAHLLGHSTE